MTEDKFFPWIDNFEKLKELLLVNEGKKAVWGRMDFQQMVEHLILVCEISNGKVDLEIQTPEKYLEKSQAFLMSDEPMPQNFVAKFIPEEPITHKHSSFQEAVLEFEKSTKEYQSYWGLNPAITRNHPVFGKLTKQMWDKLHNKHITHHLLQFGLK